MEPLFGFEPVTAYEALFKLAKTDFMLGRCHNEPKNCTSVYILTLSHGCQINRDLSFLYVKTETVYSQPITNCFFPPQSARAPYLFAYKAIILFRSTTISGELTLTCPRHFFLILKKYINCFSALGVCNSVTTQRSLVPICPVLILG